MTAGREFPQARDFLLAHREDYDTAYADFRWPVLDDFNWALDYFDVIARDNHRTALWIVDEAGEERLSFQQLSRRSNQAAHFLRSVGVEAGDRILVLLPNAVALWEFTLAAMKLGAVLSPTAPLLAPADLHDRLVRGEIRHLITDAAGATRFTDLPQHVTRIVCGVDCPGWQTWNANGDFPEDFQTARCTRPDDPLLLYFTSGTTAKPKMVLHSHRSYPIGHLSTMYWIGLKPGDVHWNISSPGWAKHAWSCVFAPWNAEATVFVFNQPRFDAKKALAALARYEVTTLCAPPTVWRMLILEDLKAVPVRLREVVSAGEPLNPEVIDRVRHAWGLTIRDGYGQTETTALIGNPPGQPNKAGSMGRPLPGYQMRLLAMDGNVVEEGEIAIHLVPRPAGLMAGYVDEALVESQRSQSGENWYRTSDVARRDADGYFWYVGRADDVFKSSDYRVSPFEIESALLEHDFVAEAAVVPSPDALRLCVPKAFIVLRPGIDPSREAARAIFAFARQRLSPFQRIRRLEFGELPKTLSGKIRRVELRSREEQRSAERFANEYWEE